MDIMLIVSCLSKHILTPFFIFKIEILDIWYLFKAGTLVRGDYPAAIAMSIYCADRMTIDLDRRKHKNDLDTRKCHIKFSLSGQNKAR